jgi:hypothetical protein
MSPHFTFRIDTWDDAGENPIECLAGLDDYRMAIAAYETAVRNKPGTKITLRQGIRVVRANWVLTV